MRPDRRRRWWSTVRVRITALATLAVAAVLVAASLLLLARQRAGLVEALDESAAADAARVAAAVEAGGSIPTFDADERVVVVIGPDGRVVAGTAEPAELVGGDVVDTLDDDGDDDDAAGQVALDGRQYRVASSTYDTTDGEGVVRVAASLEDVDESIAELRASLLVIVPLAILVLAVLVWFVVGRTLRPVERMRAQVASIGLAELDRRVPEPPGDDEIARLAVTMNEMLGRLEQAARRQQRFVADASHELRTPLTRMRTELEVDQRHPDAADAAATRRSVLEEIAALQRLIDDLLVLARTDGGATRRAEPVDLDDLVLEEIRSVDGAPITIDGSAVSAAQVIGDREELRRVVRNLLDNARRHASATVSVELTEREGQAVLVVADDGPGVPAEHRDEVFERFTRLDEARSGGAGRAGLGLAIVHDIVVRHGGTVTVDDAPAGGARFVVALTS